MATIRSWMDVLCTFEWWFGFVVLSVWLAFALSFDQLYIWLPLGILASIAQDRLQGLHGTNPFIPTYYSFPTLHPCWFSYLSWFLCIVSAFTILGYI